MNNLNRNRISPSTLLKMAAVAALIGAVICFTSTDSILGNSASDVLVLATSANNPTYHSIDLADALRAFNSRGTTIVLDARENDLYKSGHIKNAINVPLSTITNMQDSILLNISNAQEVVVYCSGRLCSSAVGEAQYLFKKGVTNAVIYSGGWTEWQSCRLPSDPPSSL